jgi:exopolyphosphatase
MGGLGLVDFVKAARAQFGELSGTGKGNVKLLRLALGNSSGDMDSVVSSIGFSYFSSLANAEADVHKQILPVISFHRDDLKLRKDIEYTLHKVGLFEDDLIFINDVAKLKCDRYELNLVDHNEIDSEFFKSEGIREKATVVSIIDHHVDGGLYGDTTNPRIIETCGSCSSLVYRYFAKEIVDATLNEPERELLLTPILIDTSCLTQRTENADKEAVAALTKGHETTVNLEALTDKAKAEKHNTTGLTMYDLLRKDYKEYDDCGNDLKLGISSVGESISHLRERYGGDTAVAAAVAQWMQQRHLHVFALMTSYVDDDGDGFTREIALFTSVPGLKEALVAQLAGPLRLEPAADVDSVWYFQRDVQKSRKAVAPLLRAALRGMKASQH